LLVKNREIVFLLAEKAAAIPRGNAEKRKSFLRWSGLAGILAGVFFLSTIVTLVAFGPSTTATPAQLVANFPNVRTALTVGNGFYFLVSVSLVGLVLGLYRVLRRSSPVALFGSVLFVLSIGVTFVEDTTQIAFDPISNLYHAAGTTSADQHTLSLLWQATQGMFNQFDVAATLLLSTGLIVLGVAMFGSPAFGKIFGGLSVAFGVAQILGITFVSTNSAAYAPFALLAFFVFPVLFGLKLYQLSKKPRSESTVSSSLGITRTSADA
jgi:hypothetical protein